MVGGMPRPLVGRTVELAAVGESLADLRDGAGALVLLVGEPGIGKSRLAEEVARLAMRDGARVVWGRAWEAGGAPPFWPWIQLLRGVESSSAEARLLEGGRGGAVSPEDRFLLFDAVTRGLATATADHPTVAILEDLHAADEPSLHLLAFVANHLRGMPLLVLGTYRDVEARMTQTAGNVLDKLARSARVIAPRRLDAAQVGELIAADPVLALDPATLPATLEALHSRSEGNPLFVTELLRVLARRGDGAIAVPASVRTAIREHLRCLPGDLTPLLEVAAVIGREFSAPNVAELSERATDEVLDALGSAVELGVLVERAPGRFAFAHGLIAETLHHDLSAARRARLHASFAAVLERTHADDPAAPLAELAHHLFEAGTDLVDRAVEIALRAAEQASRQLAYEAAAHLVERALSIVPPGNARVRFELMRLLAEVRLHADDRDRGREAAVEATMLARSLDSPDLLARAALTHGGLWTFGSTDRVLVQLIEDALAALPEGDHELRARMMARLASALQPTRDAALPMAIARNAIAMADRLGDDHTRLEVLASAIGAFVMFGRPDEQRTLNLEALALADRFDEPVIAMRCHQRLMFAHAELGDLAGLAIHHRGFDALVERLRLSRGRVTSAMMHAMVARAQGRDDDHAIAFAEAQAIAAELEDTFFATETRAGHTLGGVLLRGDRDEIARSTPLFETAAAWGQGWVYKESLALQHALLGDLDRARALLSREHLEHVVRTHLQLWGADVSVEVIWRLGDRDLATVLYDWLANEPVRFSMMQNHGYFIGRSTAHLAMLLAATLGDLDAVHRFRDLAQRALEPLAAPPMMAWLDRDFAAISATPRTATRTVVVPVTEVALTNEGEYWSIAGCGERCQLRASRGVELLARLVAEPGRELHALELIGDGDTVIDTGDAGELLDAEARAAYKARIIELREQLDEASDWNDPVRAERARDELEALEAELTRAVGLGGRARRAGKAAERARINVQRRIADVVRRIGDAAPELGKYLTSAVRTGAYCSYVPDRARRG